MKSLWHHRKTRAFTLVELLVVIAIIAILAALLLPTLTRGKQRAQRIQCIGNLNELGTAFQIFSHDHRGQFPMEISTGEGGSLEFVEAGTSISGTFYFSYKHFQALANELVVPRLLLCPADLQREPAPTFSLLQNSNVSYFVGVYANYNVPNSVLAGDRNITNDARATASLVRGTSGLRWTSGLHGLKGNVLFADTHVEQMDNARMDLPQGAAANAVFFLPAVLPTTTIAGSDPTPPPVLPSTPASPGSPSGPTGGSSPNSGSSAGSVTTGNHPEPQPAHEVFPNPAISRSPAPYSPSPSRQSAGTRGAARASREAAPRSSRLLEPDAKETNGVAAISGEQPTAAPAATDDEPAPPLLWLLGAARALVAKASGWLLLLLAILVGTAVYYYFRRKRHKRRNL